MNNKNSDKIRAALAKKSMNEQFGMVDDADKSASAPLPSLQDMSRRKGEGIEDIEEQADGIKDMAAYKEWRRLKRLPILNEDMIHVCSDGTRVNMAWFPKFFNGRTEHLSSSERTSIELKRDMYRQVHLQAIQAKMKAYGTNAVKKAQERAQEKAKELGFLKARKAQLVELFGRMFSTEEVHKIIVEDWNFPVALADVIDFKKNNLAVIKEKQEIHKRDHSDLRLTTKRSRLEEYTGLYNRLNDKIKTTINREDVRMMKEILVEIRKEIEGERINISGKLDLNIEANINEHLQKEVMREFSLVQIIVGRVASRMRVHSSRIIQGLQNSYYARYNRFLGAEPEDIDWEEIEYPSAMGFDFEKIAIKYREKEVVSAAEKEALKTSETNTQVKVAKAGLKELLMLKIGEKTGDVKREKLQIDTTELTKAKEQALLDKEELKPKKK